MAARRGGVGQSDAGAAARRAAARRGDDDAAHQCGDAAGEGGAGGRGDLWQDARESVAAGRFRCRHAGKLWRNAAGAAGTRRRDAGGCRGRSEEHTSELQSLMRISYAVFCLKKKKDTEKQEFKANARTTSIDHVRS